MLRIFSFSLAAFATLQLNAQPRSYGDSMRSFQAAYKDSHEVVQKKDKKYFHFFPVNDSFRITAIFEPLNDTTGFIMKTSGTLSKKYFRYGFLHFAVSGKQVKLTIYQSALLMTTKQYKDYLFVPFTDLTSGEQSYGGGRYLDFVLDDIKGGRIMVDFNKAYNPYCAYTTGYNCPIPPRENDLPVAISAGEKSFGKAH